MEYARLQDIWKEVEQRRASHDVYSKINRSLAIFFYAACVSPDEPDSRYEGVEALTNRKSHESTIREPRNNSQERICDFERGPLLLPALIRTKHRKRCE